MNIHIENCKMKSKILKLQRHKKIKSTNQRLQISIYSYLYLIKFLKFHEWSD